jgi:Phospholipase_D-nuclease N-terminal
VTGARRQLDPRVRLVCRRNLPYMLRALFYAIPLVLAIFAVVDCVQTPDRELRGLPRFAWLVLIVFIPIAGSVAWLMVGSDRSGAERPGVPWPAGQGGEAGLRRPVRRVVAPDDDPEFLSQLGRSNSEHDALLKQWERDLRRREDDLPGGSDGSAPKDGPVDDAGPDTGSTTPRA